MLKGINVNPGNLISKKENQQKLGTRGGKKKREEMETNMITSKLIESEWTENWNYQCKH